jgi:hypothetical protein
MHDKTKIVEVAGRRWQLARLAPVDGSYIWQRLMAASIRAQAANQDAPAMEPEAEAKAAEAIKKAAPEDRLRSIYGVASMYLTYEDTGFIQRKAMAAVSRMEQLPGDSEARPMAAQLADGRWAVPELAEDPFLVTQLTLEVLVWNLAGFLAGSRSETQTV